jgi:uncharacterized SAM-binding protein YcdF (DUF218 family)
MFEIAAFVAMLLQPSFIILALCSVGFCCCLFKRYSIVGRRLLMLGTAGLLIASLSIGDHAMAALEDRFPAPDKPPSHVDGIIVLGGAINMAISEDRDQPTLKGGADRMTIFAALARRYPDAKLLFTGGGDYDPDELREADVAHALFAALGLDVDRMMFERESRNTRENALFSKKLAQPAPGETWLLVTSAVDMPRAVGCFRAVGWPVLPWPVSYRTPGHRSSWHLTPLGRSVANLDWTAHEWIGLIYYRWRGWTDALFPAPG